MILVGVDAGGTRTRAVAVREDGTRVAAAAGGPVNPYRLGLPGAAREISLTVRRAVGRRRPAVVVAGVAGSDDAGVGVSLQRSLRRRLGIRDLHVVSDAAIALDGALPGLPGVVVIAGTGSVAFGRSADGRQARAGGWGYLVGDEGSGFALGRAVLARVLRAFDGRQAETPLTPLALAALGARDAAEIAAQVRRLDVAAVAGLAESALRAAQEGDAEADAMIERAAGDLSAAAEAVARRLGLADGAPVATVGGLFADRTFTARFAAALRRRWPGGEVVAPRLPPVGGALWRAFALRGLAPDERLLDGIAAACAQV